MTPDTTITVSPVWNHVLAMLKLSQADAAPHQATFFILEPCKLFTNLKNYTALPSRNGVKHILQPAAVYTGVQLCLEFFAQLWCHLFTTF